MTTLTSTIIDKLTTGNVIITFRRASDGKEHTFKIRNVHDTRGTTRFVDVYQPVTRRWCYMGLFEPAAQRPEDCLRITPGSRFADTSKPTQIAPTVFCHFVIQLLYFGDLISKGFSATIKSEAV